MLFELGRVRPLDRPMPAVMDARRDLVDQWPFGSSEEFDGQHADMAEGVGNGLRRCIGLVGELVDRRAGRNRRDPQYPTLMMVPGQREGAGLAVHGPRDHHAELGFEIDAGLGDGWLAADGVPGSFRIAWIADPGLPLAVIAIAAGLE